MRTKLGPAMHNKLRNEHIREEGANSGTCSLVSTDTPWERFVLLLSCQIMLLTFTGCSCHRLYLKMSTNLVHYYKISFMELFNFSKDGIPNICVISVDINCRMYMSRVTLPLRLFLKKCYIFLYLLPYTQIHKCNIQN